MSPNALLAGMNRNALIALLVVCAVAALAFLYGCIRKFSRMSWTAWQSAAVFSATLLIGVLPSGGSASLRFFLAAGGLLAVTVLVLGLGALARKPFLAAEQGGTGARVFNRLIGGLTGIADIAAFVAVFGGFALAALSYTPLSSSSVLSAVYEARFYRFVGGHAVDAMLVTLFIVFLRFGYRSGLLRSIVTLLVLALTFSAVFGAIALTLRISFLSAFAGKVAGAFSSLDTVTANVLGYTIVSLIVFLVLFAVVILIAFLLHKLLKKAGSCRIFGIFDGLLLSLIFFGVFMAVVCCADYGVYRLSLLTGEGIAGSMASAARGIESFFCSSPLSALFYECNPALSAV